MEYFQDNQKLSKIKKFIIYSTLTIVSLNLLVLISTSYTPLDIPLLGNPLAIFTAISKNTCPKITVKCPLPKYSIEVPTCHNATTLSCQPCQNTWNEIKVKCPIHCGFDLISEEDQGVDGCSGPGKVLEVYGLKYACNVHDLCYSYTNKKKKCDQALLYNLLQKCSLPGAGPLCKELSMVGYYSVEAAGRILDFHQEVKQDCDKISEAFTELYQYQKKFVRA